MANKVKDKAVEPKEVEVKEEVTVEEHEDFVSRKLKAINRMTKPAKAERVAHRLLRKARN
ncbi:MAG: hypothetical protein U0L88_00385 [Acutalibacteraceae bacterium]|nr:hypothetical protein [Acutalibacteraceae bacterium]